MKATPAAARLFFAAQAHTMPPHPDTTQHRPRILLVDDNSDNLSLVRLFLENAPYQLETAANGREAVDRFAAEGFDAIFMDLEMPVLDGRDATQAIRDLERQRGSAPVPILILTAHSLDEHRRRCREAGCTDFLVKPVRKAALMAALSRYLPVDAAPRPEAGRPLDQERLRPLLPLFFQSAGQAVTAAAAALAAGNFEAACRQGHTLKGSARTYGFEELGQAGEALERASQARDAAQARAALTQAEERLARAALAAAKQA